MAPPGRLAQTLLIGLIATAAPAVAVGTVPAGAQTTGAIGL